MRWNLLLVMLIPDLVAPPTEGLNDPNLLVRWRQLLEDRVPDRGWSSRLRATDLGGREGVRCYSRWGMPSDGLEASVVTERDPGERHLDDHLVGYLQWQHSKGRLVLGDLRAGFSQGLVFGRGSGRGRGRLRRDSHTLGLRSSAENRAIRGAAASLGRGQWLVVVLAGQLRRDARFDEAGNVRSLPENGLHTGPTALAGEDALSGQVAGLRFRWQRKIATSVSSCSIFVSVRDCGCRVAMGDLCSLAGRRPRAPSTGVGLLVDGNSMANSLVLHPRGASSEVSSNAGETGSVGRGRSGRLGLASSVLSGRRIDVGRHGMREVSSSISAAAADRGRDLPASPAHIHPHLGRLGGGRIRAHVVRFSRPTAPRPSPAIRSRLAATRQIIVARNESASPERAQVGSADGASSGTTVCPMVSAVWFWASKGGERGPLARRTCNPPASGSLRGFPASMNTSPPCQGLSQFGLSLGPGGG
ncbi:MAG: hypothetical protein CME05_04670 [Gemmatimonadaceae bacterium]|nr:hypothetical protein [Gemmatimonadaceae bacterium]